MKLYKLILRLQVIDNQIASIQEQMQVVENLPYYNNFNRQTEKEFDLANLKLQLKDLLSIKSGILDNFSTAAEIEKANLGGIEKQLKISCYELQVAN